jgi:Tol biopolymer transport system component
MTALGQARYRLLLLLVALPFMAPADLGRAASAEYNVEIVAIDLAGRQTNLTRNPALDVDPAVARDGRIAFFSSRGGSDDLYVMDGDGGNVRRVTNGAIDHSGVALAEDLAWSQASWSPRGDTIAFDGKYLANGPPCEQHCAGLDVLVIGSDGSGLEQVALGARAPAWSPDRRRLAYESDIDPYELAGSVTIARLDGSGSVRVKAINHFSDVGPIWSPSGTELAFQAQRIDGSRFWIYVVRADGTRKRRLAAGHDPSWSPDGRRLAFISNCPLINNCALFTIDSDGKHKRRLSRKGEYVVAAAWSPKGGTLAYVAGTKADPYGGPPRNLRVETVSADGKRVHVLAREPAGSLIWWRSPVWTPDGRRILVAV